MPQLIRTTITMPEQLFEQLRLAAFQQKTTVSRLVRDGISDVLGYKAAAPKHALRSLIGKYRVKGKKGAFDRALFYETALRKNVSD